MQHTTNILWSTWYMVIHIPMLCHIASYRIASCRIDVRHHITSIALTSNNIWLTCMSFIDRIGPIKSSFRIVCAAYRYVYETIVPMFVKYLLHSIALYLDTMYYMTYILLDLQRYNANTMGRPGVLKQYCGLGG